MSLMPRTTFKETVIPLEGTEGAKMSFFRVEPRGDCALAVKKGQPQPIFELKIDLDWKVEQPIEPLGRVVSGSVIEEREVHLGSQGANPGWELLKVVELELGGYRFQLRGWMLIGGGPLDGEDSDEPQMKLICDNQLPPGATPAFKARSKRNPKPIEWLRTSWTSSTLL